MLAVMHQYLGAQQLALPRQLHFATELQAALIAALHALHLRWSALQAQFDHPILRRQQRQRALVQHGVVLAYLAAGAHHGRHGNGDYHQRHQHLDQGETTLPVCLSGHVAAVAERRGWLSLVCAFDEMLTKALVISVKN